MKGNMRVRRIALIAFLLVGMAAGSAFCLGSPHILKASTAGSASEASVLHWMGHSWNITNGGMAGVLKGNPSNISVDSKGYLHLHITQNGTTWTGSEVFTQDKMGFGTFQWQIQGNNIYAMDPPIVLGLFPYGPKAGIGGDAEDELDIEFSNWNGTFHATPVNADFTVYPATGHRRPKGESQWEDNFYASSSPNYTTARIEWNSTRVVFTIMGGLQPIGTTANVIKQDTFDGNAATIPQQAMPVGMNLWSFKSEPTHPWDIIIQSFQYISQ